MEREIDCLQLVKDLTTVPVPRVLGYMTRDYTMIGAPVMLMNCLPGNVGVNLNFDFVPSQYKISFFEEMARIQVGNPPANLMRSDMMFPDRDVISIIPQDRLHQAARRRKLRNQSTTGTRRAL